MGIVLSNKCMPLLLGIECIRQRHVSGATPPQKLSCKVPLDRRSVQNYRGQARFNSRPSIIHRGQSIRLISDSISMRNSGILSVNSCVSSIRSVLGSSEELALDDVSEGNKM